MVYADGLFLGCAMMTPLRKDELEKEGGLIETLRLGLLEDDEKDTMSECEQINEDA